MRPFCFPLTLLTSPRRPNETTPGQYYFCARFIEQQTGSRERGSKDAADPAGRSRRRPSVGLRPPNRRVLLLYRDLRHHTFFLAFVSLSFMMLAFASCVDFASEVQDQSKPVGSHSSRPRSESKEGTPSIVPIAMGRATKHLYIASTSALSSSSLRIWNPPAFVT